MRRSFFAGFLLFYIAFTAAAQRPGDLLATANGLRITLADLPESAQKTITDTPTKRIGLRQTLFEEMIYGRLLALEAKRLNTTIALLKSAMVSRVASATEAQIKAVYDANRDRLNGATFAEAKPQIAAFLRSESEQKERVKAFESLKTRYKYSVGKNVNAAGLMPSDSVATLGSVSITAREFEEYAGSALNDFDARAAQLIALEAESALLDKLIILEAAADKISGQDLFAREVTSKLREFSEFEMGSLEASFYERLLAKYGASIVYKVPAIKALNVKSDDDPATGPADAPVTIVMFSDFQCSACKRTHPLLKGVAAEFPGKVRLIIRDFPLQSIHENALAAARAANAAHAQGKYFEFIELLYANQDALDAASLKTYASRIGLDPTKFVAAMNEPRNSDEIGSDVKDGEAYGVDSTPTIFVNGVKVYDFSVMGFRRAIRNALAR